MKTLDIADTGRLAEELKSGEPIELVEGGRTVAKVVPVQTIEERVEELIRQGKAHREGDGTIPDWFFTEPPPKFDGSVLEQLLEDRRKNDW
jgi:antitoxin (DNA-binding transcriptional repressor) of toxin-antitoxin stability system